MKSQIIYEENYYPETQTTECLLGITAFPNTIDEMNYAYNLLTETFPLWARPSVFNDTYSNHYKNVEIIHWMSNRHEARKLQNVLYQTQSKLEVYP